MSTLVNNRWLVTQTGNWTVRTPFFGPEGFILLPDLRVTFPLLFVALSLWFAWRVVNHTSFADFLIATEAEMNKVSWSTRAQLVRDTLVVLATVFIITAFLFVVDIFWGWILSRSVVGVLPGAGGDDHPTRAGRRQVVTPAARVTP